MSDAPVELVLQGLDDFEKATVAELLARIDVHSFQNALKEAYYDGKQRVRNMGIAIPPGLQDINTVVGWPATAVDVLNERLIFQRFLSTTDQERVDEIVHDNQFLGALPEGLLDMLICGIAFICVGTGYEGDVDPLITVESPRHMTARWNVRQRRVDAALSRVWDPQRQMTMAFTLWLPEQTIYCDRNRLTNDWIVTKRDQHRLGRVLISSLVNRKRTGNPYGRSEITPSIQGYTDHAVRTVLGMEVSREFYSAPQRYALGATKESFVDAHGNPMTPWESYMGRVLALGFAEGSDGNLVKPEVGQFTASPMTPYGDQLRTVAQLLSSEIGAPASYFGFVSENPASADAIRAAAARLEGRAERLITNLDYAVVDAMQNAMLVQDVRKSSSAASGSRPKITSVWRDPGTPTKAASAASGQALVTAGVLKPRSRTTYEYIGFDGPMIEALEAEDKATDQTPVARLLAVLANGGGNAPQQPPDAQPGLNPGAPAQPVVAAATAP